MKDGYCAEIWFCGLIAKMKAKAPRPELEHVVQTVKTILPKMFHRAPDKAFASVDSLLDYTMKTDEMFVLEDIDNQRKVVAVDVYLYNPSNKESCERLQQKVNTLMTKEMYQARKALGINCHWVVTLPYGKDFPSYDSSIDILLDAINYPGAVQIVHLT